MSGFFACPQNQKFSGYLQFRGEGVQPTLSLPTGRCIPPVGGSGMAKQVPGDAPTRDRGPRPPLLGTFSLIKNRLSGKKDLMEERYALLRLGQVAQFSKCPISMHLSKLLALLSVKIPTLSLSKPTIVIPQKIEWCRFPLRRKFKLRGERNGQ